MGNNTGKKDREGIKKYGSDKKPTVLWGGPTITPTFSENLKCFGCFKLYIIYE